MMIGLYDSLQCVSALTHRFAHRQRLFDDCMCVLHVFRSLSIFQCCKYATSTTHPRRLCVFSFDFYFAFISSLYFSTTFFHTHIFANGLRFINDFLIVVQVEHFTWMVQTENRRILGIRARLVFHFILIRVIFFFTCFFNLSWFCEQFYRKNLIIVSVPLFPNYECIDSSIAIDTNRGAVWELQPLQLMSDSCWVK